MKTKSIFLLLLVLTSCVPDGAKNTINTQIVEMQKMMADQEFKKAIAFIELHKVRYGSYPDRLSDLRFLPLADSASTNNMDYQRLDQGYELNIKTEATTFGGNKENFDLKYPAEFWENLGCVKSNLRDLPPSTSVPQ